MSVDKLPLPMQKPLQLARVLRGKDIDVDMIQEFLYNDGNLTKELAFEILNRVHEVFGKEPNLIRIDGKVTIIGDVHGQFYDLYGILKKVHAPDKENEKLLFLGDYVDRGAYGVRIILLLFALKLKFPNRIILLRGNHESREMTEQFNFRE